MMPDLPWDADAWRRQLAAAPDDAGRWQIFHNAANELAALVARGLDKASAVDALHHMASAYGLDDEQSTAIMAEAFGQQPATIGNGKDAYAPEPLRIIWPLPIDEAAIPLRPWLMPGLLMRRHVSVLVAPSGSGKSLLTLQVGLACACGIPWSGWTPRGKFKVMVINSEDDIDEMRRRLAAGARMMDIRQEDIRQSMALVDHSANGAVVARVDARAKRLIRTPLLAEIIAAIRQHAIDLVVVDPFAETFEGDENSNSELKWAGLIWREVARQTDAAILLVHHTKKYANGMAGDMDAARGAGALIGIARVVSTLFGMTTTEAEAMGVPEHERNRYLRYDDAKANLNIMSATARWYRKESIRLGNDAGDLPGDEVGVLRPWKPEGPSLLEAQILAFFGRIDQGIIDQNGQPTGEFYSFGNRSGDRSVVSFAMEFFNLPSREAASKLIAGWRKDRRLEQVHYRSGKSRKATARVISELDPMAPKRQGKPAPPDDEQVAFF